MLIRISAEGADEVLCEAMLERISDEALLYAVIKRLHVQVQTCYVPAPETKDESPKLDGMVLG